MRMQVAQHQAEERELLNREIEFSAVRAETIDDPR